jgi:hypothetical protein
MVGVSSFTFTMSNNAVHAASYNANPNNNFLYVTSVTGSVYADNEETLYEGRFLVGQNLDIFGYGDEYDYPGYNNGDSCYMADWYFIKNMDTEIYISQYEVPDENSVIWKTSIASPGTYQIVCRFALYIYNGSEWEIQNDYYDELAIVQIIVYSNDPPPTPPVVTPIVVIPQDVTPPVVTSPKTPDKTSLKEITPQKKKMTVTWKKVSGVSKYQIQYRVKGSSKWKSQTVAASKSSVTIKNLKPKTKYQVRVRSYRTVKGQNYYSKWSTIKTSEKIKK